MAGNLINRSVIVALAMFLSGCDISGIFPQMPDETFGDQNFKSAIALIELHKTRNGEYPEELSDLEHLGQWDQIWLGAVEYEKVAEGYNLFVIRGAVKEPNLEYREAFWQGLGIKESNVARISNK